MLSVQPGSHDGADEKLRPVRVWAGVSHGEDSGLGMLEGKVLIGEFLSVDRFASRSISASKVTALNHEIRDDAVELAILESESFLACAEGAEVLGRLRDDIGVEQELNASGNLAANGNVEKNLGVCHLCK